MTDDVFPSFIEFIKSLAKTTVTPTYTVTGRWIRRKLGINRYQLKKIREKIEKEKIKGIKVRRKSTGLLVFTIEKKYWVSEQ